MRLTALRAARLRLGAARLLAAAVLAALLAALLGTRLDDGTTAAIAVGAAIGTLLTLGAARAVLPRGALPPPPDDATIDDGRRLPAPSLLAIAGTVTIALGLGWWGLNAAFAVGLLAGAGAADLLSAAAVATWEGRHRQTVLVDDEQGTRALYAA